VSIVVLVVVLETVRGTRSGVGLAFLLWFGFLCLYEPVLVWRRGATLGHMAANIRVVDQRTGGNPTFLRALGRFWLKAFVGLLAFAFMGTTRRHQALHDLAARTTVEIADPAKALPEHFVEERAPLPAAGLPSRLRRVVVILAYSLVTWIAVGIAAVTTESAECLERNHCSPAERLLDDVVGLILAGVLAACIILGWTGRLWGARRTHGMVPPMLP
jgi:RDD family protein